MSEFSALELDVDQPRRMVVMHPLKATQPIRGADGNEAYIDLYSADSPVARRHQDAITNRRLSTRNRGRMTADELRAEATDLLVALTAGWRLLAPDGSAIDIPCTPEKVRQLYDAPAAAWLRDQVDQFVADRGNFAPPSSTI